MIKNNLLLTALFTAACGSAFAQTESFDLNSQRGEKQDVNMVPGKLLDHHGIVVNPTPHNLNMDMQTWTDLSAGVKLIDKAGKFTNDIDFLKQNAKGTPLTIVFGEKQAKKAGLKKMVSGAYLLTVDKKGINIVGYDERGAFYALQTLRQIVESPAAQGKVPHSPATTIPTCHCVAL